MRRSTVIFVLPCTDRDRAAAVVDSWGSDGQALGFPGMPKLHFASVTLSNPTPGFPDLLLIECCYEGTVKDFVADLLAERGRELHEALVFCRGYGRTTFDATHARAFLLRHATRPSLCQVGTRQLTARQILDEHRLRTRLDEWLDGQSPASPGAIHRAAQHAFGVTPTRDRVIPVYAGGALTWRRAPSVWIERFHRYRELAARAVRPVGSFALLTVAVWIAFGALAGVIAGALALGAAVWLLQTRRLRPSRDPAYSPTPGPVIELAAAEEDRYVQNHLPSIVTMRTGALGRLRLRLLFFVLSFYPFGLKFAESGRVFGLQHIHCSHWTLLDGGRRLLFMGNYDGSYGLYLQDFATTPDVSSGVEEFWGGGHGYPGLDVAKFQRWGRGTQLRHRVWYGAYRNLSLVNIENNHAICRGLTRPLDDAEAAEWLQRFAVVGEREMAV